MKVVIFPKACSKFCLTCGQRLTAQQEDLHFFSCSDERCKEGGNGLLVTQHARFLICNRGMMYITNVTMPSYFNSQGQRVVFCRGFGQPFEHHAVIVKSTGRGCWNVRTQSGRQQVVNQRFLRPYHSPDSSEAELHWPDDVEDASPSLTSSASPVDSSTRNHRYNLRRNAVESSKYRVQKYFLERSECAICVSYIFTFIIFPIFIFYFLYCSLMSISLSLSYFISQQFNNYYLNFILLTYQFSRSSYVIVSVEL